MSPIIDIILFSILESVKILGLVAGSNEYPITLAPALIKILHSQVPLKPVCPVTKTVLFL